MARDFAGATTDFLDCGDTPTVDFGAGNFALVCFFQTDAPTGARQILIAKDHDSGTTPRQFSLEYDQGNDANNNLGIVYWVSTNPLLLKSTANPITDSAWHHVVGQRNGDSFDLYIDGALNASGTTEGTHGTMNANASLLQLGRRTYTGFTDPLNGRMAEVAIFSRALSAGEVAALAKGFSPKFLNPPPIHHWPLIGRFSPEIDVAGSLNASVNGTVTAFAHPRVIYPSRAMGRRFTTAAAGGDTLFAQALL